MLVNAQPDMEVIGEAADGQAAIDQTRALAPDLLLMDISMPELNGLKATEKLRREFPDLKILTLTRHTDDGYLQQLIKAGVNGYVLKQSAPTELINAIRTVSSGRSFVDSELTHKILGGFAGRSVAPMRGERTKDVSDRESEVLRFIAWGYSNKEIAGRLDLSVKTVEAHKSNAMRKLNMRSRIDIVRYAILQGWLEEE
jgi:DNA-binding NarL/FixJ family response regulator